MYLVEAGVVLAVAPWTVFWTRNYFVEYFSFLEAILASYFIRGAVTGLGFVSLSAAVIEASMGIRRIIRSWLVRVSRDESFLPAPNPGSRLV